MSALRVAAQPRTAMPKVPVAATAMALILGLAIGVAATATLSARTTAQTAVTTAPVTSAARANAAATRAQAPTAMATYRNLVADLKSAEMGHDYSLRYGLANRLDGMLTAQMIGSIYMEHERLEASIAAAKADEEFHLASRLSRQLAAICGSETVKAQLDFCN